MAESVGKCLRGMAEDGGVTRGLTKMPWQNWAEQTGNARASAGRICHTRCEIEGFYLKGFEMVGDRRGGWVECGVVGGFYYLVGWIRPRMGGWPRPALRFIEELRAGGIRRGSQALVPIGTCVAIFGNWVLCLSHNALQLLRRAVPRPSNRGNPCVPCVTHALPPVQTALSRSMPCCAHRQSHRAPLGTQQSPPQRGGAAAGRAVWLMGRKSAVICQNFLFWVLAQHR